MRKPSPTQRTLGLFTAAIFVVCAFLALSPGAAANAEDGTIRFGMPISDILRQKQAGVPADYGSMWVGSWTLSSGWSYVDSRLAHAYNNDVTPMVHFYYWGDDISRECIENGCQSDLHGARKDKAGWQQLAEGLAGRLNAQMKGRPAVIIVETEFNKGDVATYEPLDGYLAEKARFFKEKYPASVVVLGFGNWAPNFWSTWDRAVAASDMTGLQAMRGSTRSSLASYHEITNATLAGAKTLQRVFSKPVFISDVALSSYPEPEYLTHQGAALKYFFSRLEDFRAAGVRAIVYREWLDNPSMDTKNYFGQAERHWGLAYTDGTHKPATKAWIEGVQRERSRAATTTAPAPITSTATETTKPPSAGFAQSVEAESMQVRSAGGRQADASASGGARWNLWSNGHLEHPFDAPQAGTYEIQVAARATVLGGIGARMVISVDGLRVHERLLGDGASYPITSVPVEVAAGRHAVRIAFTNDARTATEDRNLLVDRIGWTQAAAADASGNASSPAVATPAQTIEVEAFTTKTAGGRQADAQASSGARWNLWSNGYVAHSVELEAGSYELRVRAAGQPMGGVAPRMVLRWDGAAVAQHDVVAGYQEYLVRLVDVPPGAHRLELHFVNDARSATEDRNLLLDKADLRRFA